MIHSFREGGGGSHSFRSGEYGSWEDNAGL